MMELQLNVTRGTLLVVAVMVGSLLGNGLGDLQASPNSKYCTQHPTFLFCDFLGAQELVVVESLAKRGGQTVNTAYLHNAEQMLVAMASLKPVIPNQHFSFKLVDSSTNLVPPYVSQLDMLRSAAQEVSIDRDVKLFSATSSVIGHLKISKPVRALNIKVENSLIDKIEKLHLESRSHLVLYNVTVNKVTQSSIYLKESSMNIWTGAIKTSLEQAIILGPRASVTLKDTYGKISLAGPKEVAPVPAPAPPQQEHRPPGIPPPTSQTARQQTPPYNQSVLVWVFPTVLAAVEAIIILINCTNWFPSLKRKKLPQGLEEGNLRVTRQTEAVSGSSNSTWHYYTEVPLIAVNRRQNTEYKYK
ncbi:hypothetical protein O3P69_005041 [Scylla paramamosain]|uniref:Uncharacterized protein n=1 Tax=Scylla paramamosain TaxID=85552 RepID=A0AAW0UBU6_SCYPA